MWVRRQLNQKTRKIRGYFDRDIEGSLDYYNESGVAGWAWDRRSPDRRLDVQLSFGDKKRLCRAQTFRADLLQAGKGDGCYGFSVSFEPSPDGAVRAQIAETLQPLIGSPAPFVSSLGIREPSSPPTCEGSLDGYDDTRVYGWAWNPEAPRRRLVVEITMGGRVCEIMADVMRPDLAASGRGDGRYGFSMRHENAFDPLLVIRARAKADEWYELPGSPLRPTIESTLARPAYRNRLDVLASEIEQARVSLKSLSR